jgi:hypothetical protein
MQTNQSFSFQRLLLLGKQSYLIRKRSLGISLGAFTGIVFFILLLSQSNRHFTAWSNNEYMVTFTILFFVLGMIFSGNAFPAFRSKEKSMAYLMLPATSSEKFVFELVARIVLFIILMPAYYWIIANIEGIIVHSIFPEFPNYAFSFGEVYRNLVNQGKLDGWAMLLSVQGLLFVFIVPFTGATYFSKAPIWKTWFTVWLIVTGFGLYIYLLIHVFNLSEYHPANNRVFAGVLFIHSKDSALAIFALFTTIVNICLVSIAWFKLKEKEA